MTDPRLDGANATTRVPSSPAGAGGGLALAVAAAVAACGGALPWSPFVGAGKHRAMAAVPLTERIRRAGSAAEIDALLAEGAAYPRASARTRREWDRVAAVRRLVLGEVRRRA